MSECKSCWNQNKELVDALIELTFYLEEYCSENLYAKQLLKRANEVLELYDGGGTVNGN